MASIVIVLDFSFLVGFAQKTAVSDCFGLFSGISTHASGQVQATLLNSCHQRFSGNAAGEHESLAHCSQATISSSLINYVL